MTVVESTDIPEVKKVLPKRFGDERGYFSEVYNAKVFESEIAPGVAFSQDNESLSSATGTIRGLHFQAGLYAQGKLVRVLAGSLLDVAVDLRQSSPTFGQSIAVTLSAAAGDQLWIPAGFAHGFCTLEPNTVIGYKASGFYDPESDRTLAWDDPDLSINWPEVADSETLSAKDAVGLKLAELQERGDLFE